MPENDAYVHQPMSWADERFVVRVEAALDDFKAGRMTVGQLREYLRRASNDR